MPLATPKEIRLAIRHLSEHDPILQIVIEHSPVCEITPHRDYYQALVNSIVGQQLSVKAAAAIRARFLAVFDGQFPSPAQILEKGYHTPGDTHARQC